MQTHTFKVLLHITMQRDMKNVIKKRYRGGRQPVEPDKALLVFLRYMASQETLHSLGDRFNLVPATVINIVNGFLYLVVLLKSTYIRWLNTAEEFQYITNGFHSYPDTIGAVDGSHIDLKVPMEQHDSYIDRYQNHSINLMGICTYAKLFTYVFIGYPGSAHDSRVFSNSQLVRNIERMGSQIYFPREEYHIIGDAASPLRVWLMTPYSRNRNLTPVQKHHNKKLSSARVRIENTFSDVKQRWARLKFINTYSILKAIEISTAACVLHNFCLLLLDEWPEDHFSTGNDESEVYQPMNNNFQELAQIQRDHIARTYNNN